MNNTPMKRFKEHLHGLVNRYFFVVVKITKKYGKMKTLIVCKKNILKMY